MGAPFAGRNGLIYVGGTELIGANSWSISYDPEITEAPQFGDTEKRHIMGLPAWSGSIATWDQADDKPIQDAATGGVAVALLIYPARGTLTSYYSGNAIFGFGSEGDTGGVVGVSGDFTGDGALTIAGFS